MADFVARSQVAIHDWSDLYGVGYAPEYFGGTSRFQISRTAITKMAGSELLGECTFTVKFLSNNTEDPAAQRNSGYNYAIDYEIYIDGVRRGSTRLVSRTQYINKNTTYTRTIRATNIPLNTSTTRPAYIRTVNDRPSSQALLFDSRNQGGDSLGGFPLGIQRSNFSSFSGFTLTNSATTFNATVTRVSSGTTHTVSLWHSGTRISLWTDLNNFTNLSLTLAESRTLLSRLSSVKSATVELRVGTIYGGTQLYIQSRTATVTVGEVPTIGAVGISDSSGALTEVGNLVQGISNVTLSINTVSAGYGASINTYGMEWAGVNHSGLSSATLHTGIITRTGNQTFTGRVSNSRDQIARRSRTDNVLAWSPPTSSNISIVRANSGGSPSSSGSYVRVSGTHSVSALKVGTTNKNTLKVIIRYRERGVTAWTSLLNKTYPAGTITTSEAHTLGGGNVSTLKSYEVQVEVVDRFSNYITTEIITSEQVPFSVGRTGVGIGKIWEKDALEVYGNSVLNGDLDVLGDVMAGNLGRVDVWNQINVLWDKGGTWGSRRAIFDLNTKTLHLNFQIVTIPSGIGANEATPILEIPFPSYGQTNQYSALVGFSTGQLIWSGVTGVLTLFSHSANPSIVRCNMTIVLADDAMP